MTENWRPVLGYEGRYQVSDLANVRNAAGHLMKTRPHKHGYPMLTLWDGARRSKRSVHSLVMEAFVGPRPPGLEVCHGDGNAADSSLSNLRYGTKKENAADRRRHGRDQNANLTHCKRGHPLDQAYVTSAGKRQCRTCHRDRTRQYRQK